MITSKEIIERLKKSTGYDNKKAGILFQRFIKKFLQLDTYWSNRFEKVWNWNEYPQRGNRIDTGIDLVAQDREGNLWAIQVKFHESSKIDHNEVSKFIATATPQEFNKRLFIAAGDFTQIALETLKNNEVEVLTFENIVQDYNIDWALFNWEKPEDIKIISKEIRPYQREAIEKVIKGFQIYDRGKLIMPPGSGKTFVSLKIAEQIAGKGGYVLFLVPSIALADQTLRAWLGDIAIPIRPFAVTSDKSVGRDEDSLDRTTILMVPPTTNPKTLFDKAGKPDPEKMTVIVSTYHSIDVISQAQGLGFPEFDLIICDEAHYTTGVALNKSELSFFKKVHFDDYVKAKKRLYMTATPKVFSYKAKSKAAESEIEIYSMDDEELYGPTFYTYTFYKAVEEGYLSDYKVIVMVVTEKEVQEKLYEYLNKGKTAVEDTAKIVGIFKVVDGQIQEEEKPELKRGVVFTSSIARSRRFAKEFPEIVKSYNKFNKKIVIQHIDGNFPAFERKKLLDWLREEPVENEVRILSNAKVLTEGIDVPALDCIAFFDPRKSTVDIIQAMGRVMRKVPEKRYGYVIIPVIVDPEKDIETQLATHQQFQTLWQIVSALRSLDESFTAKVRQIMIKENKTYSEASKEVLSETLTVSEDVIQLYVPFEVPEEFKLKLKKALIPKIVEKVGGRKYIETWAKDTAKKVKRIREHIKTGIEKDINIQKSFDNFLQSLRQIINPAIDKEQAISMLAQHIITKPIFDAIFENYDFLKANPISNAIEVIAKYFENFIKVETEDLEEFYREVKIRAKGMDKEEERQDFLRQLYDSFFKIALPDIAEKLGIVYTPVELVDFLIKSIEDVLKQEFNKSLNDKNVVILEPFCGTGTFLVRLINFLKPENLKEKYKAGEIWGNEILLLPYYIALTNVESTYYAKTGEYKPFRYLLLTDTFQLDELRRKGIQPQLSYFPKSYTDLMEKQIKADINVIISNPPWFAKQEDYTKGNQALKYEELDNRIKETYVKMTTSTLTNALYDSYVRAIRFASDRIDEKGIVAFVLNNGFLDSTSFDGFRKSLQKEFKKIYVFNLRGDARTSGERRKQEGGGVFGQGSRAGVCLLILVKDKKDKKDSAEIYYYQVEDYLTREQKLAELKEFGSLKNVPWQKIEPDEEGNWINLGRKEFKEFISILDIFEVITPGIVSGRDWWVYDFSKETLERKMKAFIEVYNQQLNLIKIGKIKNRNELLKDTSKISWTESLVKKIFNKNVTQTSFKNSGKVNNCLYRPFIRRKVYYSNIFIERPGNFYQIFPEPDLSNQVIFFTGTGANKDFSAMIANSIVDYGAIANTQCIPLYIYYSEDEIKKKQVLFKENFTNFEEIVSQSGKKYYKKLNLKNEAIKKFREFYGVNVKGEDIFYYIYAILNHPEYKELFGNNLKKELPKIPFVKKEFFNPLIQIGKELAELHLNYENADPYPLQVEIKGEESDFNTFRPTKMKIDKNNPSVFYYNDNIIIKGIPQEAYNYKVGGRSPIEWIAEYYKIRTDKKSQITIDPTEFLKEINNPKYIIKLIQKVITVSLRTQEIFKKYPKWEELVKM